MSLKAPAISSRPQGTRKASPLRLLLTVLGHCAMAAATAAPLPRSTPEAQGVSPAALRAFVEAADQKVGTMHSFMLVRHGQVVAEGWWKPESPETPHVLHSLSKSFTSTAVGLAIGEGKLSLDARVLSFFPDDAPAEPSENLRAMRVRDLLTMSTGHESEPKLTPETPWVRSFLAHPVPRPPGTHFVYNSAATYMLSAIVQKVTGEKLIDFLKPRLFEPLGIENPQWDESPQGINVGGWGLRVRTEDIAKFGLLYARNGRWDGRQLLPETWAQQATAKQVANGSDPTKDWTQGYGYQFWRCRHGAFRGDGAFGQFCIVLPEFDAVLAMTADTKDMQGQLNLVWDHLLPALRAEPLPADPGAAASLAGLLSGLAVPASHVPNVLHPPGSAQRR